jgi:hypothetical protein
MSKDHLSPNNRPTMKIRTGTLLAKSRNGETCIMRSEEPEQELGCFDAKSLTGLPFLLSACLEYLGKDPTVPEEIRKQATETAQRMRYAFQLKNTLKFSSQEVFKLATEFFGKELNDDDSDITISRSDLKAILACSWGFAMEEFSFTPFEDRANHIFPAMAELFEQITSPNEELRQFVNDGLSAEVEALISTP